MDVSSGVQVLFMVVGVICLAASVEIVNWIRKIHKSDERLYLVSWVKLGIGAKRFTRTDIVKATSREDAINKKIVSIYDFVELSVCEVDYTDKVVKCADGKPKARIYQDSDGDYHYKEE